MFVRSFQRNATYLSTFSEAFFVYVAEIVSSIARASLSPLFENETPTSLPSASYAAMITIASTVSPDLISLTVAFAVTVESTSVISRLRSSLVSSDMK